MLKLLVWKAHFKNVFKFTPLSSCIKKCSIIEKNMGILGSYDPISQRFTTEVLRSSNVKNFLFLNFLQVGISPNHLTQNHFKTWIMNIYLDISWNRVKKIPFRTLFWKPHSVLSKCTGHTLFLSFLFPRRYLAVLHV